jgi:hypothetical protein
MSSSVPTSSESDETAMRFPAEAFHFVAWLAALNLAWENVQMPFYTLWKSGSIGEVAFAIMHCTAGDVIISFFSGMVALLFVRMRWPRDYGGRFIFCFRFHCRQPGLYDL